jgi:molybdopterin-binding protein
LRPTACARAWLTQPDAALDNIRYNVDRPPRRRKRIAAFWNVLPNPSFPESRIHPPARSCRAAHFIERPAVKLSARNQFKGKILEVKKGATTAHVRLEIAPGIIITSSITNEAVEELGLKVGGSATAVIKASSVMIAVD